MRHDNLPKEALLWRGLTIFVFAVELMLIIGFILGTAVFMAWILTGAH